MAILIDATCDYAETRPAVPPSQDPTLDSCHSVVASLALAGLIYEACIKASMSTMGLTEAYRDHQVLRNRLRVNVKMIVVFAVLTAVYHCIAFDVQLVHRGWLADYYGRDQMVYSVRYVEWTFCTPLVISVIGQLPHSADGSPRNGLIASSVLSGAYWLLAWQGLVVKNVVVAWLIIGWVYWCYALASIEQLFFAWYLKDQGSSGPLRAWLLVSMVVTNCIYGVMYTMSIFGWISPTLENKFYCVADMGMKLALSITLIATYDIAAKADALKQAEATAGDYSRMINAARVPAVGPHKEGKADQGDQKAHALAGPSSEKAAHVPSK